MWRLLKYPFWCFQSTSPPFLVYDSSWWSFDHLSELSYRQVAARDYRVPEGIKRHSVSYDTGYRYYCTIACEKCKTILYYLFSTIAFMGTIEEEMWHIYVVGNPNGVPEDSHVVSNVAETDTVSKERFARSSTVSFALDSSIGGVSTVHNHRSSTVQFPVECCTLG